jgi:DNA-binding winged helix-turn-helix (wHTH) protein
VAAVKERRVRYVFDDCVLDTDRRELWRGGTAVAAEPLVFDLLAYLIENRDRVVSKDDLLAGVWQGRIVSESTLGSTLNAARTAIGDNGEDQRLIRTLPRKGFRFVGTMREEQASAAPVAVTAASPPLTNAATARPRGAATPITIGGLVGAAAIAATLGFLFWPAPESPRTVPSGQRFDASTVPLITDDARRILASYPNRPDVKAVAIGVYGFAVADGQPNAEAARQDALQRCNAKKQGQCRIYAVGADVVWSKEALPLPAPDDLRFEPLDLPLAPDEIPIPDRARKDEIAKLHMKARDHRGLAISALGAWTEPARATRAEAARLAVERCTMYWQRPCLLLAVDGMLTTRIPKSRPAVGIFLPSVESDIPASDRKRVGQIYRGSEWRAVAKGKGGEWHAVAGASSETDAIDAALKSCAQSDSDCRLFAIGNFRVAE